MRTLDPASTPDFELRPGGNDASVVREVWIENVYRLQPHHFWEGTGVCMDLGANIGAFTLFALAQGAQRVVACEPDADNLRQLRSNLVRLVPEGLTVQVVEEAAHGADGFIHLVGGQSRVYESDDGRGRRTRTRTLAYLFERYAPEGCDFLKLDIEGSEYPVFEAAPTTVVNRARRIALEFHQAPPGQLGLLVEKLCESHHVEVFGKPSIGGGYVFAHRYGG